ncbi:hypothetical protein LZ554_006392 [Drepanopeziza brunnea f. sp. 'monogermtubi']|nr:hypothetical protein LZ554_006392 [Drepanopeziza brunnea f. sp. 'monogermtubi']
MKLTRVKRIEGDLAVLRQDLQTVLGLEDGKAVVVNPVTRQVIVKGHFKSQIQQFFQDNPTTVVAAA